jgi:hypothetical protein
LFNVACLFLILTTKNQREKIGLDRRKANIQVLFVTWDKNLPDLLFPDVIII